MIPSPARISRARLSHTRLLARWRPPGPLVAAVAAAALFFPLRSIQWDLNGIGEAKAIGEGGARLFEPNHLLYRPLGAAALAAARAVGYAGHSAALLQWLTAGLAAIGVGAAWSWFRNLTGDARAASLAAVFLATSWSYWTFSTDVYYITPAAAAVAGALALAARPAPRSAGIVVCLAALAAIALLFWQANIFFLPLLVAALRKNRGPRTSRDSWREIALVLAIAAVFVLLPYVVIGIRALGLGTPGRVVAWIASLNRAGEIALWGKWSSERIVPALSSALASLVSNAALPAAAAAKRGILRSGTAPALLALLALMLLVFHAARALRRREQGIGWLLLAYAAFFPFVVWWDPFEPKWFVVPNLFVAAILAVAWSDQRIRRGERLAVGLLIATLAAGNLASTIWPRHTRPNPNIALARCFAGHASAADVAVITDWNWFEYATYFFGFGGESVWLIGNADHEGQNERDLRSALETARTRHGRVLLRDPESYPPAERELVRVLTGLRAADLASYARRDVFRCGDVRFQRLTPVRSQRSRR